jgi:dTDP-4-dehydrorhamnose reductase
MSESEFVLLGAGGMLHRAWIETLTNRGLKHRSLARAQLDLTRPETIGPALGDNCKLVINCAAYTDVDKAESEEATATAVNGIGVGRLALHCRQLGATLVHYSTDYVFNGKGVRPYRPDDPIEPLGAYGRSKAVGEKLLRESGCKYLLIRTSWLYAPWGKNFVRTIARVAREGKPLRVVNDQQGRPTSSEHLARTTLSLIEHNATGIYHATDGGECTWFEFASEIARIINPQAQVSPCTTAEFPRPAQRPAYSVLDLDQTERLVGPMLPWRMALADVMERLE